jgi:hypothetical protein
VPRTHGGYRAGKSRLIKVGPDDDGRSSILLSATHSRLNAIQTDMETNGEYQ